MEVLTTGTASGLGRYLHRVFSGRGLQRENAADLLREACTEGAGVVLHCAFASRTPRDHRGLGSWYRDNLDLTRRLLEVPHRHFVYLSTVDVYPQDATLHHEDDLIEVGPGTELRRLAKLTCEAMVLETATAPLVLRPTSLVGPGMRRNTLVRLLDGERSGYSLSGRSQLNLVRYGEVEVFLRRALAEGATGVFNLACAENVSVQRIAELAGTPADLGDHVYDVGWIDHRRAVAVLPELDRPSEDVVRELVEERDG